MKLLLITLLISFSSVLVFANDTLHLPPVLSFRDGTPVKSVKDWKKRRAEILHVFEQEMYGVAPSLPKHVKYSVEVEDKNIFGGKATKKRVNLYLKGFTNPIELLIYYPNNGSTKVPAFLGCNFWGNYSVIDDPEVPLTQQWVSNHGVIKNNRSNEAIRGARVGRSPIETITDAGYAVVTFYYGDIDPDYDDGYKNGLHPLFKDPNYTWGSIAEWAWGLRYVMNYIEKDCRIDSKKVAVIGHSRLGKTALWAGATDQRFAMVISNNSGCTGAALSRRKVGERFDILVKKRSYWYSPNFSKYDNKEEDLEVDQHQLIALIAPRPVYVASAVLDVRADPEGEYLSLYYGSEAYKIFNLKGLENKHMPAVNSPYFSDQAAYHIRTGKHDLTEYDWIQFIKFADIHLK